jgi:hypothetical protein
LALSNAKLAEVATVATATASCFLLNIFIIIFLPD